MLCIQAPGYVFQEDTASFHTIRMIFAAQEGFGSITQALFHQDRYLISRILQIVGMSASREDFLCIEAAAAAASDEVGVLLCLQHHASSTR